MPDMNNMKSHSAGIGRIFRALRYSAKGLRAAWQHEAAFRQEIYAFMVLVPFTIALGLPLSRTIILLSLMGAVLVVELINSAIESIVDKVSPNFHELAGRAKDCGSAAVLVTIMVLAVAWLALAGPEVLVVFA